MSAREWKPGDVAMVAAYNRPEPYRAYFDGKTWREYGADMFCVDEPTEARPLVVIDPEDREQVERLQFMIRDLVSLPQLREALENYLSPKPEEPTGRYAVVVDSEGIEWMRRDSAGLWMSQGRSPSQDVQFVARHYGDINAVRVLSEGVTA